MLEYKSPNSAKKKKFSLRVRVSFLLVLAVVLPLIITLLGSFFILRPTLITQASTDMENDAQAHAQAIDEYFIARVQELDTVGQYTAIQKYVENYVASSGSDTAYQAQAANELETGYNLDADYVSWAIYDNKGKFLLAYPSIMPPLRGHYTVSPEAEAYLQKPGVSNTYVSDVYYDSSTNKAFVDLYTQISGSGNKPVGYVRATVNLDQIWTSVNNEANTSSGTYAMILDNHGVRIAYTNSDPTSVTLPQPLFKAIAPLDTAFQKRVKDEGLYGADDPASPFGVLPDDSTLVAQQKNVQRQQSFQITPALQTQAYQVSRATGRIIPWTYIVLRPVNVITQAADTQTLYLFLLAAVITGLAAVAGLVIGRRMTRPILSSVSSLMDNSLALRSLAETEQHMAKEQKWIVESSQSGLQSVKYYAEATSVAARKLDELSTDLAHSIERHDAQRVMKRMEEIVATAKYVEKAAINQKKSSAGLGSAISITAQVTDQLLSGATSATEAAARLDEVVEKLRDVAGT
jgi:methyl-accepting chemotaxis protein